MDHGPQLIGSDWSERIGRSTSISDFLPCITRLVFRPAVEMKGFVHHLKDEESSKPCEGRSVDPSVWSKEVSMKMLERHHFIQF